MTARTGQNLVCFTPDDDGAAVVWLSLETEVVQTCGLKPNVIGARCSYKEFAKLKGNAARTGRVGLWDRKRQNTGAADVRLDGWSIVNVEASEIGIPGGDGNTPIVTEYRLSLADFRDQYVDPRGGRLRVGLVNPGPKPKEGDEAKGDEGEGREMKLSEMIVACLKAMGVADVSLPDGVDASDPPRDVKWFGSHAPAELEKLLALCGCVFVPFSDGTGSVRKIGKGDVPTYPDGEALAEVDVPNVDRRGRAVVFSSFPTRVTVTYDLDGPSDDTWYFVIQDKDDKWQNSKQDGGLLTHVKDHFARIALQFRERVENQAYKFVQLNRAKYPGPVLVKVFNKDGSTAGPAFRGILAVQDPATGLVSNSTGPITVPGKFVYDQSIVQVGRALIRVGKAPTLRLYEEAVELGPKDCSLRFSQEKSEKDKDGKWRPVYFHCGFRQDVGGLKQMSQDEVENAIDGQGGRDVFVVTRPEFRLLIVNNEERNRKELEARAKALAESYLADSGRPIRLLAARGFQPVECSGLVAEVRWDQQKFQTTAILNNWWTPDGALAEAGLLVKLEEGEAYPNQKATEAGRKALGESGANDAVAALEPLDAAAVASGAAVLTQIDSVFASHGGFYSSLDLSGPASDVPADTSDANQNDLAMPEGQQVASRDHPSILYNTLETGRKGAHLLKAGQTYPAVRVGYDPKRQAEILATAAASAEHAFLVELTKDGGADGTLTTEVSYTYTAKVTGTGQVLGKQLAPLFRLVKKVPTAVADKGLLCFDGTTAVLFITNEKPNENACPTPS